MNETADNPGIDMWFAWAPRLIRPVRVERVTSAFVWVKQGRSTTRHAKHGTDSGYYETWEEAHAFLTRHADAKLMAARLELQRCQSAVGNVRGMRQRPAQNSSSPPPSTDS